MTRPSRTRRVARWVAEGLGIARSLIVYWRPGRQRGLRRLYAPFVRDGDLVFDIGAHLGDRSAAFASLGARVVAVEPQPRVARWLTRLVGRDGRVTVRNEAVGSEPGVGRLSISRRTPTVSSMAETWRRRMPYENPGFRGVRWDDDVEVPVVTLDGLIEEHGAPSFCKIDVEGWETEVLSGLSRPLPALSFEFVAGDRAAAETCVRRLCRLGPYRFNAVLGERRRFLFEDWRTGEETLAWLRDTVRGSVSGDLYARLDG